MIIHEVAVNGVVIETIVSISSQFYNKPTPHLAHLRKRCSKKQKFKSKKKITYKYGNQYINQLVC